MSELKAYDKAASMFYKTLSISEAPLLSWDIYSQHFFRISKCSNDAHYFNNLSKNWKQQWDFNEELFQKDRVVILTDAVLNIVYSSYNITGLNGYTLEEIKGKSPKMFQGKDTCKKTSDYIRKAIQKEESFQAKILNYKKNGSTYLCDIEGHPIHNKKGELINFIAFECPA
ncbi:PAS domain-containing protein [Flavobacteriaceae bacterium R38]|nr:PAS domain-containing protein [Flavobacteriaceae bacterium R38]